MTSGLFVVLQISRVAPTGPLVCPTEHMMTHNTLRSSQVLRGRLASGAGSALAVISVYRPG